MGNCYLVESTSAEPLLPPPPPPQILSRLKYNTSPMQIMLHSMYFLSWNRLLDDVNGNQFLQFISFQSLNQLKQPLILLYVDAILSCSLLFSLALNFYFGYFFLLYNFLIYKKMALMDFKALSHWNNFSFFSQFWFLRVDIACLQLYGYFLF